jgi:hypothetical protein
MIKKLLAPLVAAILFAPAFSGCNDGKGLLRAKQIENRSEVVGGPVSVADVGDFLLENDEVRIAILGKKDSPGPGVYGGSVVDFDRRRPREEFSNAQGHDRFAEMFPVANLLVPDPDSVGIRVLKDGSDGQEAVVSVDGDGEFLFEALSLLRDDANLLGLFFPDIHSTIHFHTEYVLRPGDRHLTMRTTLRVNDPQPPGCPSIGDCSITCDNGLQADEHACPICKCSDLVSLDNTTAPVSVFGTIFGDVTGQADPPKKRAGVIAGDFVFFGNQNDVFAPGPGFDEDAAVQDAYNEGRNQFQQPLVFDFVAATAGDISYGYFTAGSSTSDPPLVNVPLFASAATAFLAAHKNCSFDMSDDETCTHQRAFTYERYLVAGDGDVASVLSEIYKVRKTPTGTVRGHVLSEETGEALPNAHVFVFYDPKPDTKWESLDQVIDANLRSRGDVGMYSSIDADLGLDLLEDGDFEGQLPEGSYVLAARDEAGTSLSDPVQIQVKAGQIIQLSPKVKSPAHIHYRVVDQAGIAIPAKVALISVDAKGNALEGDGKRRVYLGDGRLGNGKREISVTPDGEGSIDVEPGRYKLLVSRGPEYSLFEEAGEDGTGFELVSGQVKNVDADLVREVDTAGWMGADMHLHSTPSFDSGMPIPRRVTTVAAEGVEFALATDHDAETDYTPTIRNLRLEAQVKTAVSAEVTTLEMGHFIGFPLKYDALYGPTHGAHDWTCETGGEIMAGIRSNVDGADQKDMFLTVAHPRDGFFGYVDQHGVDGFTLNRKLGLLEQNNPVFRTADCSFDGMEIIAGKRFDLIRTPSVAEIVEWHRCLNRVAAAQDIDSLAAACPEAGKGPLAPCDPSERFPVCRTRARNALASIMLRRVLERTAGEQDRNWNWAGTMEDSQKLCSPAIIADDDPVPPGIGDEPCSYRPGQVDDYFRYLERGLLATQVSSSDGHNDLKEPGYPRTYFLSPTDDPLGLSTSDVVKSLRAGQAFSTYGPFVWAQINGKTYGQTTSAKGGDTLDMLLDVRTADWFGVDRVEVYVNGRLAHLYHPNVPVTEIHDLKGKVPIEVPSRDSWVVIAAMGLRDENLMSKVSVDVPFGEIQLSVLAADAFSKIPVINTFFTAPPTTPDWSPIIPYAITNPIYIDTDGNGKYDPPLPYPDFCSKPCTPGGDKSQCPMGQSCLEREQMCGINVSGKCDHRIVATPPAH